MWWVLCSGNRFVGRVLALSALSELPHTCYTCSLFSHVPHLHYHVQGPCLKHTQLPALTFHPALGSHLAEPSSGQVTETRKDPWQLWPVSWCSITVFTCQIARSPGLFAISLITEEVTKVICLPNSTEFKAVIVQIKTKTKTKKTHISTWPYTTHPTILNLKYKVQILTKSSYCKGQSHRIRGIVLFSKWVNKFNSS